MILAAAGGTQIVFIIGYIIFFAALMYFIAIRPQKKQQKKQQELLNSMEKGDSVLTTSGFYGVVIDITDDTVIVEFGNNKNCRIPMHKNAIAEIEKAGSAVVKDEEEDTEKVEKKEDKKADKKL